MFKKPTLLFVLIFTIGLFLRFYNYQNRWTLSQDQARDAIIGNLLSLQNLFPLIGPPSSLGHISFGPFYYWLIILFEKSIPIPFFGPWIGFTVLASSIIPIFFIIGKMLRGSYFGLLLALISSFSSGLIFHSVDMLNPMLVPFFTSLSMLFLAFLLKKQSVYFAFLLGLSVGLAVISHFQAFGLISFILIGSFFTKNRFINIFSGFLGIFTTFIPLIIFNYQNQNKLINNFFSLTTQTPLSNYINNPFKEIFYFWPKLWGEALTFIPNLGFIILPAVVLILIFSLKKKLFLNVEIIFLTTLSIQAFLTFIYPGAKTPVYLLVFYPFIFYFTGLALYRFYNIQKNLGIAALFGILIICSYSNINILKGYTQNPLILEIKNQIGERAARGIQIYQTPSSEMISLPLYYIYQESDQITDAGFKIGVCDEKIINGSTSCPQHLVPFLKKGSYLIYDLNQNKGQDELFEKIEAIKIYSKLYDYY